MAVGAGSRLQGAGPRLQFVRNQVVQQLGGIAFEVAVEGVLRMYFDWEQVVQHLDVTAFKVAVGGVPRIYFDWEQVPDKKRMPSGD